MTARRVVLDMNDRSLRNIVLGLGGYSWAVLNDIEKKDDNAVRVNAYAQQFAWTFGYPEDGNKWSEGILHVPVNR